MRHRGGGVGHRSTRYVDHDLLQEDIAMGPDDQTAPSLEHNDDSLENDDAEDSNSEEDTDSEESDSEQGDSADEGEEDGDDAEDGEGDCDWDEHILSREGFASL
jgi:hypothetical protein